MKNILEKRLLESIIQNTYSNSLEIEFFDIIGLDLLVAAYLEMILFRLFSPITITRLPE